VSLSSNSEITSDAAISKLVDNKKNFSSCILMLLQQRSAREETPVDLPAALGAGFMSGGGRSSAAPLKQCKALLDKIVGRYGVERTEPFFGEGRPLFSAVCKLDLERDCRQAAGRSV
jgi:hypothetical protein